MIATIRQNSPLKNACTMLTLAALTFASVGELQAKTPLRKFKGDIIVSVKPFPRRFKSDRDFIKHMRKVNTHEIKAEGEDDWQFNYMAFLKGQLGSRQGWIVYYDVTQPGSAKYINSYQFHTRNPEERIQSGTARLSSEQFKPDRKYVMAFKRSFQSPKALAETVLVLRRE